MFNVGDLVKRIKVLFVSDADYDWIPYSGDVEEYGIVVDIEMPMRDKVLYRSEYPEVFVKVLWQNTNYGAMWHWGDELLVINKGKNT